MRPTTTTTIRDSTPPRAPQFDFWGYCAMALNVGTNVLHVNVRDPVLPPY